MVEQVWVRVPGDVPTVPGLVLKWRKSAGELRALVTYEAEGRLVTEWVPTVALLPADGEPAAEDADGA